MLHIEQLHVTRGQGAQAVRIELPALSLMPGKVLVITGPSGCGKSTLLEMVGLILAPDQVARFELGPAREDVAQHWQMNNTRARAQLRARQLGFMLQSGGLLPYLSVAQNIALPCQMLNVPMAPHVVQGIEALGITPLLNKAPRQLSIGERQRVAFLRALAHGPGLLLADEPTAALDPDNADRLFDMMLDIARLSNTAVLLVSHDLPRVQARQLPCLTGRALCPGQVTFLPAGEVA